MGQHCRLKSSFLSASNTAKDDVEPDLLAHIVGNNTRFEPEECDDANGSWWKLPWTSVETGEPVGGDGGSGGVARSLGDVHHHELSGESFPFDLLLDNLSPENSVGDLTDF